MRKILLGLIGLLFAVPAVAATLPDGYTELEYIESTGSQYIDTGIKQQDGDEFGLVYQQITLDTSYRNLFGAATSGQASEFYISQTSSMTYVGNVSNDGIPHNTNKHTLSWVTTSSSSQNVVVDGQTYVVSVRITPNPNLNVMVFARNANQSKMIGKVYGYYQKRNGEYLINLVPAKNSSGVVGMYDTVSGRFFTNAGTGEFIASPEFSIRIATTAYNSARFSPVVTELNDTIATIRSVVTNTINQTKAIADLQATKQTRPDENCPAGKKCLLVEDNDGMPHWYEIIENAYGLPSGYTALEYLQSRGAQYINTGIYATQNTAIETRFINLNEDSTTSILIGNGWSGGNYQLSIVAQSGAPNKIGGLTNSLRDFWTTNTDFVVSMNKNGLYVNNSLKAWSGTLTEFNSNNANPLYLLGDPTASNRYTYAKLFYMKIYNNDTLVRDLIPAKRNGDNVLGMYDLVSGQFFTNAGTGTFVAGPEI